MKRFALVAIAVAAMIVCATGAASAAVSDHTKTYVLTPTSSDFPNASGWVSITISGPHRDGHARYYDEWATFQFRGLAASTSYYLYGFLEGPCWFTTDQNGDFNWDGERGLLVTKTFPTAFYVTDANTGVEVLSSH